MLQQPIWSIPVFKPVEFSIAWGLNGELIAESNYPVGPGQLSPDEENVNNLIISGSSLH